MPSLAQLDQAVREFLLENPDDIVTVVVDASFGHRIDPSELKVFEEAEAAGEVVSPPAGAIGRGDAFLLRIADKTGATVLSNDSFQEFHGDYEWLFDRGRLIGGKPVPGVGWIFTPRTPVRGPRSREAVKEAKRKTKGDAESAVPGLDLAASRSRGKGKKTVERAIAVALEEAVTPKEKPRRRRKNESPPADPVNDPLTFITFIAAHPLGAPVTATVDSFASHGAFVDCEGARCYVPLSAMGDPPPKSAREIFGKGQEVTLVVQALDPQRRGVELALPGFAKVAGAPTEETVEAEIGSVGEEEVVEPAAAPAEAPEAVKAPAARRRRSPAAPAEGDGVEVVPASAALSDAPAFADAPAPLEAAPAARKAPAKKAPAKKAAAKKASPKKASPKRAAPLKEAAPKKAPAKRAPAKRASSPPPVAQTAVGAEPAAPLPDPAEAPTVAPVPAKRAPSRRRQPAATLEVPATLEEVVATMAPGPEAPKAPPRKRASASKKAAAASAEEPLADSAATNATPTPAPATTARKRAAAKKAVSSP